MKVEVELCYDIIIDWLAKNGPHHWPSIIIDGTKDMKEQRAAVDEIINFLRPSLKKDTPRSPAKYILDERVIQNPTHEEIMTRWWWTCEDWIKVIRYNPKSQLYSRSNGKDDISWSWFISRPSACIPPEGL